VAKVLDVPEQAETVIAELGERIEAVKSRLSQVTHRPKCVLMEWIDPPFSSGHWGPELIELAGGIDPIGLQGEISKRIPWDAVWTAQPDVIVLACCGHRPERTLDDLTILQAYPDWDRLPAVRRGRVYVVDANAYFSRPGPRIVDSLEILAEIIHPDVFAGAFPDRRVVRVGTADQADTREND
jgi:iron complex transport system substrate-binding protein